ncbi:MAG: Ig-like domain-containing protein [Candidatus Paceibacterota bacterium]|nr:MAG: Ig-like domain-containing protein [Candidatus Paceibacterota bacterium]
MTRNTATEYVYTHTVGAGDGTVTVSLSNGTDLAGNALNGTPTSGATFVVDNTVPGIGSVSIISDNAKDTSLAKAGDEITLSFVTDEATVTPVVTVDGNAASVSGGPTSWSATYTMASGDTEGVVTFTIDADDLVGNSATQKVTVDDASTVTFDETAPTLSPVSISSNNLDPELAKQSDVVTVAFTADEAIDTVSGSLAGRAATISNVGGNDWEAEITMNGTDPEGAISFSLDFEDAAGNIGTTVSVVSDSSLVIYDRTAPTAAITYSDADGRVKAGDSLTITATFTEDMDAGQDVELSLSAPNALGPVAMTRNTATEYVYTHTVGAGDGTVTVSLSNGTDLAGNALNGTPTSGATFVVDNTVPTVTGIRTLDADFDGSVDSAEITFSENILDSSFSASVGSFSIGGNAGASIDIGSTADDNVIIIELGTPVAGTDVKDVLYTPDTASDLVGNLLGAILSGTVVEVDDAGPVMISAITTSTTTIEVTFSEDLNGTTVGGPSDFSIAGGAISVVSASQTSSGVVTIITSAFGTGDTPLVSLIGSVADDPSAGSNVSPSGQSITPADGVAPVLLDTNVIGATVEGAGDTIALTFSEPVAAVDGTWSIGEFASLESPDDSGLNMTDACLTSGNVLCWSYSGNTLTITLPEDVSDATTYLRNGNKVSVTPETNAIRDVAGNFLSDVEIDGTTAVSGDTTGPIVTISYTASKVAPKASYGWFETVVINADFDEAVYPVVPPTIAIGTAGDGDLAEVAMLPGTGNTHWTYTWQTPGAQDEEGTVTISVIGTDLAGNSVDTLVSNVIEIDNIGPVITVASALDVDTDSATLTATTDELATCRYSNVNTVWSGMVAMGTTGGTSHSHSLTGLLAGAQHTYYTLCRDAGGHESALKAILFTTDQLDEVAPTVDSQTPTGSPSGISVAISPTVTFSEAMDPSTVNSNTVKIKKFAGNVDVDGVVVTLSDDRLTATLNPSSALEYGTAYYLWVSGAKDAAGNTVVAYTNSAIQDFTTELSPADTSEPIIVSTVPADNAGGVGVSAPIFVTFDEEMMESTINSTNIELRKYSDDSVVSATVSLIEGNTVAMIAPAADLTFGEQYYIMVATGAQNSVGIAFAMVLTKDSYDFTVIADSSDDIDPPTPVITTPAGPISTPASIYTISGTAGADTPDSERVIRVYRDDGISGNVLAGQVALPIGQTDWSVVVGLSLDAGNTITATSTDASGNTGAPSASVVITNNASDDVDAPVISDIQVTGIGSASATVTWVTDELATSNVEWGLDSSYGDFEPAVTDVTADNTTHSVILSGLSAGTEYHFRVISEDGNGYSATSTDNTFTTVAVADSTGPTGLAFTTASAGPIDANEKVLTGIVDDDGGIRTVQIFNDSGSGSVFVGSTVVSAGQTNWSFSAPLVQGASNSFTAIAYDASGNPSTPAGPVLITEAEGAAALEVTNISSDPSRAFAIANDSYTNGWQWFFDVTIPTSEASVSMKFSDFVSGTNTIAAASNIRYYSAQSSNAATSGAAITVGAANTYAGAMTMTGDLDANTAGRQVRIVVEAKIPTGSSGGVYSADYGIQSL